MLYWWCSKNRNQCSLNINFYSKWYAFVKTPDHELVVFLFMEKTWNFSSNQLYFSFAMFSSDTEKKTWTYWKCLQNHWTNTVKKYNRQSSIHESAKFPPPLISIGNFSEKQIDLRRWRCHNSRYLCHQRWQITIQLLILSVPLVFLLGHPKRSVET